MAPQALTSITVTNPTIGIIYIVGESRVVRWTHTATTGTNVKIELLKAGVPAKTISSSTPNDDQMAWTVPSVSTGNDYQIRVTSATNAQYTGISGNFTIQGSTPITVLTSIIVSPGTVSINAGGNSQLGATCKDQNGATMTCPTLIWTSNNPSKVTVDSTGKVTGIAAGIANITAKSGTITSNISVITVIQQFSVKDVTAGSVINNVGVLAILDPAGNLTKDQACVEVCRLLGTI
jgi:uncharacterized protein YjdB